MVACTSTASTTVLMHRLHTTKSIHFSALPYLPPRFLAPTFSTLFKHLSEAIITWSFKEKFSKINGEIEGEVESTSRYVKECTKPLNDFHYWSVLCITFGEKASANQELNQQIPQLNLPWKILCRVCHVHLLAESDKDEVYAQITLHSEPDESRLPL
ncbi:unnamed protein product [Fraxinus pennsylvanica]|uniref:Uncharacterized protein n=1 Tax=Fraxinus pennsylvanica TaxID=56036 RepID=A0AAD2DW08_9LAMI|nr:unnamed protein product [Fraxinus pennsylvanica]